MRMVLAVAASILLPSTSAFGQCSDAQKKELEAFDHAWGDATESGDRAAMAPFFADDYQGFGAAGMQGKATAIEADARTAERNRANPADAPRAVYASYSFSCTPTTATIAHRTTVTTRVNGKDQTFYNRSVHFLEKRMGRWQAVANVAYPLDDSSVLAYIEGDWNDAALRHDPSWFERNYAYDASDISSRSGGIMTKAQAVVDAGTDKTTFKSLDLSELNVRTEGNAAVVTGVNHEVGRDPQGKPFDRRVRFTDVYIKRDGRWQVWATQGTTIAD
ncbi:MAG TPA: nuclear transport factor 2 family protein [Gemmatimonadaceae bacterium]